MAGDNITVLMVATNGGFLQRNLDMYIEKCDSFFCLSSAQRFLALTLRNTTNLLGHVMDLLFQPSPLLALQISQSFELMFGVPFEKRRDGGVYFVAIHFRGGDSAMGLKYGANGDHRSPIAGFENYVLCAETSVDRIYSEECPRYGETDGNNPDTQSPDFCSIPSESWKIFVATDTADVLDAIRVLTGASPRVPSFFQSPRFCAVTPHV